MLKRGSIAINSFTSAWTKIKKQTNKQNPTHLQTNISIYVWKMSFTIRLIQLCISLSYVVSLYISTDQPVSQKQRNEPRIIRQRMKYILYICCINIVIVPLILSQITDGRLSYTENFLQMGIIPGYHFDGTWDLARWTYDNLRSVTLICVLYMGPITDTVLCYVIYMGYKDIWYDFLNNFNDIWGVRNYIFAPITEELVFTGMLLTCQMSMNAPLRTQWDLLKFVVGPSLYFGVAHIHHAWEMVQDGEQSMAYIIMITMFQALYTTIFGTLSNYIYLVTGGNLWSCILLHGICNLLGFPSGSELASKIKSPVSKKLWNHVYISLLVVGLISFSYLIVSMTDHLH